MGFQWLYVNTCYCDWHWSSTAHGYSMVTLVMVIRCAKPWRGTQSLDPSLWYPLRRKKWYGLRWFETTHNIVTPVITLNQSEDHHHHHHHHHHHKVCCLLSWLLSLLYSPCYFHAHPPHVLSDTKVSFQSIRTWGPMGSHDPGDGWCICWGNYDDLTATSLER